MTLVSKSEYARRCGVSHTMAYKWETAGRLVLSGKLVDVEASDARRRATAPVDRDSKSLPEPPCPAADSDAGGKTATGGESPSPSGDFQIISKKILDAGKAESAHFSGKLRSLEYKEKAGKLGSLEEIHNLGFRLGRMLRDQMTPWGARLGGQLGLDPEKIRMLETEVADVLETIDAEVAKL